MLNSKLSEPNKIILIGASTGGPGHINKILSALKPEFNATIVIAQHMGNVYIPSFAKRLDSICDYKVLQVVPNAQLLASHIYISSFLTSIVMSPQGLVFLQKSAKERGYNPDIDYLYCSAAKIAHRFSMLGIILTGMGDDGVKGCKLLSENGGECIAESETSAIVDGMSRQARNMIPNIKVLCLDEIINRINQFGTSNV